MTDPKLARVTESVLEQLYLRGPVEQFLFLAWSRKQSSLWKFGSLLKHWTMNSVQKWKLRQYRKSFCVLLLFSEGFWHSVGL